MSDLERLRHFVAVVEHRGFRRAATAIHLSQPALTKSIQRLERSFGVELIDRSSRAGRPTAFGEIVLSGARRVLAGYEQTRREVDLLKGFESGVLVVGCDPYASAGVLAPALADLVAGHPKLRYEIVVGSWSVLKAQLLDRSIDLHVGASPEVYGPEVTTVAFPMEPVTYFCRPGHPVTEMDRPSIDDLKDFPRIGIEAPPEWTRMYLAEFDVSPLDHEVAHYRFAKADSWEVLKAIVRRSDSISGGPRSVIEAELEAGLLVELFLDVPEVAPEGAIAYLADRVIPPSAEALIGEIVG